MTSPARGGAAAGRVEASEQEPVPARPAAMLVRMAGRWMCWHQVAEHSDSDGPAPDVQLHP